jgi:hypothetical protein
MAFNTVTIPITEIQLSNFITDIAEISNANDILLKDALEELLNGFEIDLTTISIGTTNAIAYIRTKSVVMEDTGFVFQTGIPSQIIAKLEKNISNKSILTIDNLNVNQVASLNSISTQTLSVLNQSTFSGKINVNSTASLNSQIVESKETLTIDLIKNGASAESRITLTSSSKKNIFVKLKAVTAPSLNYVYDGVSAFDPAITLISLNIDFDSTNPPSENSVFTIHLVDVVESISQNSIYSAVISGLIPIVIRGGVNNSGSPAVPVYLHNDLGPLNYDLGINPNSINVGSDVLKSNVPSRYGHNVSLVYIVDENTLDRLIITSSTGLEFFNP